MQYRQVLTCFAGLAKHEVIEHEDGTITVSPSIEVRGGIHSHMVSY